MRWRVALRLLVALGLVGYGCLGAGPFFLTDLTYIPETGDRLLPLDVHITDSGMIQVCMGVYDTRRITTGRRPRRVHAFEVWPEEHLPMNQELFLEELDVDELDGVRWKKGDESCGPEHRDPSESVETGWQSVYRSRTDEGERFVLTREMVDAGTFDGPAPPLRAVAYRVAGPNTGPRSGLQVFFFGQADPEGPFRGILIHLDGRHVDALF